MTVRAGKTSSPTGRAQGFVPGQQSSPKRLVLHQLEAVECCDYLPHPMESVLHGGAKEMLLFIGMSLSLQAGRVWGEVAAPACPKTNFRSPQT